MKFILQFRLPLHLLFKLDRPFILKWTLNLKPSFGKLCKFWLNGLIGLKTLFLIHFSYLVLELKLCWIFQLFFCLNFKSKLLLYNVIKVFPSFLFCFHSLYISNYCGLHFKRILFLNLLPEFNPGLELHLRV